MTFTAIVLWATGLLQAPLLAIWLLLAAYLVFMTGSALLARLREVPRIPPAEPRTRFTIRVPAHNEALVIDECLRSLAAFDYPRDQMRVLVIADNCTDDTADLVRAAGAGVYERTDAEQRGKGYALEWALGRLLAEDAGWTDAVVVFDADTLADPAFLRQMDARLQAGSLALQGQYNVLDPFHNWRTALLYCALLLFNRLRPLARQTWGATTLLKGNGMCFARRVVEQFGWSAYSLAEDIEFTTTLLRAGIRVEPVPGAVLYAQVPQTAEQARSQRMRWEGGRFALVRRDGPRLLREFLRERSVAKLDWAMDLFTPPLAILVGVPLGLLLLNAALGWLAGGWPGLVLTGWALSLAGAAIYVVAGLLISGADRRAYLYLLATPLFMLWKLRIYGAMLLGRGPRGWVRTERTTITGTK
jgi:cellulose synthase/poly-beta-1,6-N-acetylglucosamine synthase-like glycosyltransferase